MAKMVNKAKNDKKNEYGDSRRFRFKNEHDCYLLEKHEGLSNGQEMVDFLLHVYKVAYLDKVAKGELSFEEIRSISLYKTTIPEHKQIYIKATQTRDNVLKYKYLNDLKEKFSTQGSSQIERLEKSLGLNRTFYSYKNEINKARTPGELKFVLELVKKDSELCKESKDILQSTEVIE